MHTMCDMYTGEGESLIFLTNSIFPDKLLLHGLDACTLYDVCMGGGGVSHFPDKCFFFPDKLLHHRI